MKVNRWISSTFSLFFFRTPNVPFFKLPAHLFLDLVHAVCLEAIRLSNSDHQAKSSCRDPLFCCS